MQIGEPMAYNIVFYEKRNLNVMIIYPERSPNP